jgi:CBS domain containing-hemolysin-like protein
MNDEPDNRPTGANGGPDGQGAPTRGIRQWLRRVFGMRNGAETLRDTIEELIENEEISDDTGGDELVFLRNILKLRDLSADDVMVPRADITAVEIDTSLPDLVTLMSGKAHSRVPVYRETLDDAVGMVHIKDVLACWDASTPFELSNIVRRVLFVAPSMPMLELLLQMRANRTHMALVVDEFGGIDGLITIEDLVEEIVGEIEDEHDAEAAPVMSERADGSIEADARVEIEHFERRVGPVLTAEEREDDIDTLGGLVFAIAGRVPGRGEVVRHESGIEFEILDADPRRVKRLKVGRLPTSGP